MARRRRAARDIYGFPYAVVDGTTPLRTVQFQYADESDGVNHSTGQSFPFYPIPPEAISQAHWVEGGAPGNVDQRSTSDRHLLIVDRDHRHLYELYNVFYDGTNWRAGSGAFFDLNSNARRPDGWTSADAAGLAILPGLVRYDEASGAAEILHAFRVTVRATNGYVYPASHRAGSTTGALPMGARLRLKASRDISGFTPQVRKIFRAMQRYGLIVADNGSDMYISGTFDTRWNNDVLNPAFRGAHGRRLRSDRAWLPAACAGPANELTHRHSLNYSCRMSSPRAFLQRIAQQAMRDRGFEPDFSAAARAQAARLPDAAPRDRRRDLRDLAWCSVDNDDSRDLDQLSVAQRSSARGHDSGGGRRRRRVRGEGLPRRCARRA